MNDPRANLESIPGPISAPITVLGAGSWGTALAVLMAGNGFEVTLWGRDRTRLKAMRTARENVRYLPGVAFPPSLRVEPDLEAAVADNGRFVVAVPAHAFPETLDGLRRTRRRTPTVIWGTKGLSPGSGGPLSETARERLGEDAVLGIVSGPSFALEIAHGRPAALTVAARDIDAAESAAGWFRNDRVRVYASDDLTGVQLGGAIKNVMAIATGISDGLGLGANSRAALITRGLAEMNRLGRAMGGRIETFMGLTGVGDLILTCTDDQSRNRRLGLGLGRGERLEDVREAIGQHAEGIDATREARNKSRELGVEMPITEQVYRVLYEALPPMEAARTLLTREPTRE